MLSLEDTLITALALLVLLLIAVLVMTSRYLKAKCELLLKQQAALRADRITAIEERELLIEAYVRLVEDRRQARLEMERMNSALETALEHLQGYERQYGIPVSSHGESAAWIDPHGNVLQRMRVEPGALDSLS